MPLDAHFFENIYMFVLQKNGRIGDEYPNSKACVVL